MFSPGAEIKRASIHDRYGGNRQSGISVSAQHPYIFIFSGSSGAQYGYEDDWLNSKVFYYTGEGSSGDMQFVRGNLALRDHMSSGKRVFLFEALGRGVVRFQVEVELFDVDFFEGFDVNDELRQAIKFFFKRVGEAVAYVNKDMIGKRFQELVVHDTPPTVTERTGLVTSRVGQGAYRKSLIHRWENQCAVTGYNYEKVLIASHIVPWKEATDRERLDVNNGILLSPTFDALFDKGLISFGDEGEILMSNEVKLTPFNRLGVTGKERISALNERNLGYLETHRRNAGM